MKPYEREYKGGGEEIEPLSEEEVRLALRGMHDINEAISHLDRGRDIETTFYIYRLKGEI